MRKLLVLPVFLGILFAHGILLAGTGPAALVSSFTGRVEIQQVGQGTKIPAGMGYRLFQDDLGYRYLLLSLQGGRRQLQQ